MKKRKRRKTNKGMKFPPEVLRDSEVRALVDKCSAYSPCGIRDRALIITMYRSSLRVSEALSLEPKDVDLDAGLVRVLRGKGNKFRTVGIDSGAASSITKWLAVRKGNGIKDRSTLFCSLKGRQLNSSYMRQLLPKLARKAQIQKRVHPHGLRHTLAAQLAEEGLPINVIQAQLGHSNAATTSRYLQHIAPQQLIQAISKREWQE